MSYEDLFAAIEAALEPDNIAASPTRARAQEAIIELRARVAQLAAQLARERNQTAAALMAKEAQ